MAPIFEAPIFKGLPLVYGVVTEESELGHHLPYPMATLKQTHSDQIVEVSEPGNYENYDGLITTRNSLPLVTRHADCQILVLYDKRQHLLANIHAGWRGLKAGIYTKTLQYLIDRHQVSPQDLLAFIGPSLGQKRSEYIDGEALFPTRFHDFQIDRHYDLKAIAKEELLSCGLLEAQLEISPICTASDPRFHSYRRDKTSKRNFTYCYLLHTLRNDTLGPSI